MIRFIFAALLYLFATGCSGSDGSDPNLPPTTTPPSKPAQTSCPYSIADLAVPCSPGLVCDFPNGTSTLRCGCSLERKLSCGELPL